MMLRRVLYGWLQASYGRTGKVVAIDHSNIGKEHGNGSRCLVPCIGKDVVRENCSTASDSRVKSMIAFEWFNMDRYVGFFYYTIVLS